MPIIYNLNITHIKRNTTLLCIIAISITIIGCGTIMHGSTQEVSISSNPTEADVFIDDKDMGKTPINLNLDREHKTQNLRVELDGYLPYEMTINRKVSGWAWGNLAFGGLPGVVVDAISGGLYKLTPEQIEADLKTDNTAFKNDKNEILISVVLRPKPDWEKVGQLQPVK